jgi:tetratricopeptide (TPR) repeat protein
MKNRFSKHQHITKLLLEYDEITKALENSDDIPEEDGLKVLLLRDQIKQTLDNSDSRISNKDIKTLRDIDIRLLAQSQKIQEAISLEDYHLIRPNTINEWWWHLDKRVAHMRWIWKIISILLISISVGLSVDISSRFLSEGADSLSIIAVVFQSVITVIVASGTFTDTGNEILHRIFSTLGIPSKSRQFIGFLSATILLLALILLRISLPQIAIIYNNRGAQHYSNGQMLSASYNFQRAIKLNPDYLAAHYNLGLLYDDLNQIDLAKREYLTAVLGGMDAAYNNLARLYILDENYSSAVSLLLEGLEKIEDDTVKYDMLKNLGWARFLQGRFPEAKSELEKAILINDKEAPAYCLMAELLQTQNNHSAAESYWELCLKYADSTSQDEDRWIGLAQEHLK